MALVLTASGGLLGGFELPELAEGVAEVELAGFIRANAHAGDVEFFGFDDRLGDGAVGGDLLGFFVVLEAPDFAGDIVGIDVVADEVGEALAAIDVAAGDGLAVGVVMVFPDGVDEVLAIASVRLVLQVGGAAGTSFGGDFGLGLVELVEAFANAPAVVAAFFDDVDFFPEILADVGGPEELCYGIEGHAPDVAEAEGVDFSSCVGAASEGVVLRNGVGEPGVFVIDVDAEKLAEDGAEFLTVALRIVGRAAVAEADIEVAVGTEGEVAAFVVPEGMRENEEDFFGFGVGLIGVFGDL